MKVLIVAKTRMGGGACIGAITEQGESVRLVPFDADPHDGANLEYDIGSIWEISSEAATSLIPPHNENIIVVEKEYLLSVRELVSAIELLMPSSRGGPNTLYEGLLQNTGRGSLFITERSGIPPYSTTFWRPDQALTRDTEGRRVRYRYPAENGECTLTFVGFQEPLETIPAGTLLRVSLAHWWRPENTPDVELRCYAQLSGWFLEEAKQEKLECPVEVESSSAQMLLRTPLEILQNVFGHVQFRPLQAGIIDHILERHDLLIVLPTGGGKSLCYQVPALIFDGVTVVVSPLISLMRDQVMQLQQRNVSAVFLNSTLGHPEYLATMQRVKRGNVKLLYIAPETLMRPEILLMLDESNMSCLAIDEAHCISEWGYDFRPEYRELVSVRKRFPQAICLTLTATATPRVREDIRQLLNISEDNQFLASFDRENLFLAVELKVEALEQSLVFLNKHRQESGIIYCQTREQVESLAHELTQRGIRALPYHAGLDSDIRSRNQDAFITGESRVIVATVAFGMGIDKEDVRFVLHVGLPKEPESYYQEVGRAGRDGNRADCLLLFSWSDMDTIRHFIDQGAASEREGRLQRLNMIVDWATSTECRRKELLAYFGEQYESASCGMCDNCRRAGMERVDLTTPTRKFLSCVVKTKQFFGEAHIINVLLGSKGKKVLENGHHKLSTYGDGTEYSKERWRYLAFEFLQHKLIKRNSQHGSLRITEKGRAVLKGQTQFFGLPRGSVNHIDSKPDSDGTAFKEPDRYAHELFEELRIMRRRVAEEEQMPAFVIFHDQTLREMATRFPQTAESFREIPGIGLAKVEKYANVFLPIICAYCQKHGLALKKRSQVSNTEEINTHPPASHTSTVAMKCYEVSDKIEEALLVQGDESFDSTRLERLNLTFDERVDNCAAVMKNLKAQAGEIDAKCNILQGEIRDLQRKKRALENNRKGIAEYIKNIMNLLGLKKARNSSHQLTIARSPLTVEVDMDKLDAKWIKRTENVYADKRGIIDHIKQTGEIPNGVEPIENTHLRVS